MTKLSYAVAIAVVAGHVLLYFLNYDFSIFHFLAYLLQAIMIAVTLIVVAVPEGLPMAVTLSLAYSMRRMLKTNNLVRKMHACETMGAATVICTDKTGTLTQNQMKVSDVKLYHSPDKSLDDATLALLLKECIAANSTASLDLVDPTRPRVLGNPTEGSLLLWLRDKGEDYLRLRDSVRVTEELPFSTERKYMARVVESSVLEGRKVLYVKGAPEIVMELCRNCSKENVNEDLTIFQKKAMRTLGFAYSILENGDAVIDNGLITNPSLQFFALAAISDPVRPDVRDAVQECVRAGINVKIVTGDTSGTSVEIARQIGLWTDKDTDANIITGPQFSSLSDDELLSKAMDLKIVSRARPMDKKRLVEALQKLNQVVAVTGDGTNDAPALKAAHVGLSMGDGTSVAKDSSDITIVDNSFSSICKAVMWGRSLYQNIQRFLLFQLTVNVTACLLVLVGSFMGTESPLTVTQMLWINLIMDTFAAMALASLPPSVAVMNDKPRDRRSPILGRKMILEISSVGVFFFLLLLSLFYIFQHCEVTCLTDLLHLQFGGGEVLSGYELTLLFTVFVMTHFFYLFDARAFESGRSALHFKGCGGLLTIVAIVFLGQIAMVEVPVLQEFFNVQSLKLLDWTIIILGSSLVLWVRELWHLLVK